MKLPKVKLITFAAGNSDFRAAAQRLSVQANSFPLIDEVEIFDEIFISELSTEAQAFISKNKQTGYGYWVWKPFLVRRELERLDLGDVLIYLDAGCEINERGIDRFTHYLDFVARNRGLFFTLPRQQRHWSKFETRNLSNYFRNQIVGGIFILEKSNYTLKLVEEWVDLSAKDGFAFIDNELREPALEGFVAHRNDQATLSEVVFNNSNMIFGPDETFFEEWSEAREFPLLAMRNKSSKSLLTYHFGSPTFKLRQRIVNILRNPRKSLFNFIYNK